jgi:hypothetical protein
MDDFVNLKKQFFRTLMAENANPCRVIQKRNCYVWRDDQARLCAVKIEPYRNNVLKINVSSAYTIAEIFIGNTTTLSGVRFQVYKSLAVFQFYSQVYAKFAVNAKDRFNRAVFSEEEGCWTAEFFIVPEELDMYGSIIAKCVRLMGMSNEQHLEVLMLLQYGDWGTPLNNTSYLVSKKASERMMSHAKS